MFKTKNIKKVILIMVLLMSPIFITSLFAQPGPPPPPMGVPIDGLSGILVMASAAFFGKKYLEKK